MKGHIRLGEISKDKCNVAIRVGDVVIFSINSSGDQRFYKSRSSAIRAARQMVKKINEYGIQLDGA